MNIFDCFTYNNEEMILDLRLSYLDKYVKEIDFYKYGQRIKYSENYPKDDVELGDKDISNIDESKRINSPKTPKTPIFPKQDIISIQRNKIIKI